MPTPSGLLSSRDVCRDTGLTPRELSYAVTHGHVPAVHAHRGSGTIDAFSVTGLRTARVYCALRRAGIHPHVAGSVAAATIAGQTVSTIAPGVRVYVDEMAARTPPAGGTAR